MRIAYVRWRDASYGTDYKEFDALHGTVELHEVGFLVNESDETVALSLEWQDGSTESRNWLIIPRVNIVEMRVSTVAAAFRQRKKALDNREKQ